MRRRDIRAWWSGPTALALHAAPPTVGSPRTSKGETTKGTERQQRCLEVRPAGPVCRLASDRGGGAAWPCGKASRREGGQGPLRRSPLPALPPAPRDGVSGTSPAAHPPTCGVLCKLSYLINEISSTYPAPVITADINLIILAWCGTGLLDVCLALNFRDKPAVGEPASRLFITAAGGVPRAARPSLSGPARLRAGQALL